MKTTKLFCILSTLFLIWCCTSCSDNGRNYCDYVSDKVMTISSLNVYSILENAGCDFSGDSIALPTVFRRALGSNSYAKINALVRTKSIDPRKVIIAANDNEDNLSTVLIIQLTNASKFVDFLNKELNTSKTKSVGGIDYYESNGLCVAIDGNIALLCDTDAEKMHSMLNIMREDAAASPLSSWKKKILDNYNAANLLLSFDVIKEAISDSDGLTAFAASQYANADSLNNASLVLTIELADLSFTLKSIVADVDGRSIASLETATIDKSMLRYIAPEDFAAIAVAFPDGEKWKEYTTSVLKQMFPGIDETFTDLYKSLAGTSILSFGYKSISALQSEKFHAALAMSIAEGKEAEAFSAWRKALEYNGIATTGSDNYLTANLYGVNLIMQVIGHDLVICTETDCTKGSDPKLSAADFGEYQSEMVLKIPAKDPQITMLPLPFSLLVDVYSDGAEGIFKIQMGDTEGLFLENLLNLISVL